METETIRISLPLKKIKYFAVAVIVILIFGWLVMRNGGSGKVQEKQKDFVAPLDFGVVDPGFEGKISKFTMLNAKTFIDAREKIDGASSLKISFSNQSIASVKVPNYFNVVSEGRFYRLGFWARSDSDEDKSVMLRVAEKEKNQDLGKFLLSKGDDVKYFEFDFLAGNDAQDLIFTSTDEVSSNVWIDDVSVEKLDVNSLDEMKNLEPTIVGGTIWKNVDQSQLGGVGDSGDFLSKPARKIGQIFHPSQDFISGVSFKILRHGTGGTGNYQVQLREFDEDLGVISDEVLASVSVNHTPNSEALEEIKKREKRMREDVALNEKELNEAFLNNEQDIKAGKIENSEVVNFYPDTFTQDQIDAANAAKRTAQFTAQVAKRAAELEIKIREMKEDYNDMEQLYVPIASKLDPGRKYWIGLDNAGVVVDLENYISIASTSEVSSANAADASKDESAGKTDTKVSNSNGSEGFSSEISGVWENSPALWFETFYPVHRDVNKEMILSGATISDMGNGRLIYRYGFSSNDWSSLSGFSGRKIYDMWDGSYQNIDNGGNYKLSYDDFSVYKFNTVYPAKKIIVRGVNFHQSLALEISTDGESWEEIYSDNPAADSQSIDSIVFNIQEKKAMFYLRIKPSGDVCAPYGLSIEAELEK